MSLDQSSGNGIDLGPSPVASSFLTESGGHCQKSFNPVADKAGEARIQPLTFKAIIAALDRDDPQRTLYLRQRWQGVVTGML